MLGGLDGLIFNLCLKLCSFLQSRAVCRLGAAGVLGSHLGNNAIDEVFVFFKGRLPAQGVVNELLGHPVDEGRHVAPAVLACCLARGVPERSGRLGLEDLEEHVADLVFAAGPAVGQPSPARRNLHLRIGQAFSFLPLQPRLDRLRIGSAGVPGIHPGDDAVHEALVLLLRRLPAQGMINELLGHPVDEGYQVAPAVLACGLA